MEQTSIQDLKFFHPACLKVLLIDDSCQSRKQIQEQLCKYEYQVESLSSSLSDALVHLRKQVYDLILSELKLFEDADQTNIKQLRNIQKKTPLIVYSQNCPHDMIYSAIQSGAADYWEKPFCESQVKTLWQHVLRKSICNLQKPQQQGIKRSISDLGNRSQNKRNQMDCPTDDRLKEQNNKQLRLKRSKTLGVKQADTIQKDVKSATIDKISTPSKIQLEQNQIKDSQNGLNTQIQAFGFQHDITPPYFDMSSFHMQGPMPQACAMFPNTYPGMFNGMAPLPFTPFPQLYNFPNQIMPDNNTIKWMQNNVMQANIQSHQGNNQTSLQVLKDKDICTQASTYLQQSVQEDTSSNTQNQNSCCIGTAELVHQLQRANSSSKVQKIGQKINFQNHKSEGEQKKNVYLQKAGLGCRTEGLNKSGDIIDNPARWMLEIQKETQVIKELEEYIDNSIGVEDLQDEPLGNHRGQFELCNILLDD